MKANQKIRDNNEGVTPTLTILLVIPVILMVISAIAFWAQSLIEAMGKSQDKIHEIRDDIEGLGFADLINASNIIKIDNFEDLVVGSPQWNVKATPWSGFVVGENTKANLSYYSGHLGGFFYITNTFEDDYCRISRTFNTDKCYGNVSIELAFTISENEDYKTFGISQIDEKNNGSIKIDFVKNNLSYYSNGDYYVFNDSLSLFADPLCWHTMKLVVNFDNDNSNPISNPLSLHYVSFTLDGVSYDLSNFELDSSDPYISDSSTALNVSYKCAASQNSESWIDDFVITNLEPFKNMNIKFV